MIRFKKNISVLLEGRQLEKQLFKGTVPIG